MVQTKKTYTIATGIHNSGGEKSVTRTYTHKPAEQTRTYTMREKVKKAMTMARNMSLATRADIDYFALIEEAKENCRQPIKLSWENIDF